MAGVGRVMVSERRSTRAMAAHHARHRHEPRPHLWSPLRPARLARWTRSERTCALASRRAVGSRASTSSAGSARRVGMREPFARVPGTRIALAVMVAVVLTATSCSRGGGAEPSGSAAASGGPAKEGGTLRIAAFDGIDSMNPYVGVNDDSYATYEYIYPQLVQYDENVAFAPDFATDWSSSEDGLKWTFHTQPDATWSDGEPLTAEDVVWTYQTIIKFKDTV